MDNILISLVTGLMIEILALVIIVIKNIKNKRKLNFKINKDDYIAISKSIEKKDLNKVIEQLENENKILSEQIRVYENTVPAFNSTNILSTINIENNSIKNIEYYVYAIEDNVLNNNNTKDIDGKKCIILKQGKNYFGRKNNSTVDVDLDNPSVSRVHFVINILENSVTIEDCCSTNGTLLNKSKSIKTETPLNPGNIITAGNVDLMFCAKNDKLFN